MSTSSAVRRGGARDAFFKADATGAVPVKTDTNLRERDVDKESEKPMYSSGLMSKPAPRDAENYIGFASLPNQVYRKSVKRGFEFTLMVVGESGLGKSTLINSMFLTDIYNNDYPGPSVRGKKTVEVETNQVLLKEGGVQLRLTVVDTPGFGDAVNNSECWRSLVDYIDLRYEEFMNAESRVNRRITPDTRVHCCLYFISPNGHGLKPLDVEVMKQLHHKVNIIPLIAKADTMTAEECRDFKKTIMNEITQHKINIYEFPNCADEEENKMMRKLKDRVPFAVIGSNTVVESQGKKVRGRIYPWGVVEVENLEHNDFVALRNMLLRVHMHDLKDVTNNVHYENFRYSHLATVTSEGQKAKTVTTSKSPLLVMDEERREHVQKMKKMEAEMEQVFEIKVKEKMQKLKDSENDLQRRAEQMKKSLEQQEKETEEKMKAFEAEREAWEEQYKPDDQLAQKKDKKKTLF